MKKGFTLVELLAVIVIVSLLALLILPNIMNQINSQRVEVDNLTKELISVATEQYMDMKSNDFKYKDKDVYCITLQSLVDSKLLQDPIMDSNNEEIELSSFVEVNVSYGESPNPNFDIEIMTECTGYIAPEIVVGTEYDFNSTTDYQIFVAQEKGYYKLEAWGSASATRHDNLHASGSYTSGNIYLAKDEKIYIYTGNSQGYNGGGLGGYVTSPEQNTTTRIGVNGGGATDFRLVSGSWNDSDSLSSRIMVAAGAGGLAGYNVYQTGGHSDAGGLIGYTGDYYSGHIANEGNGKGATQTSGGINGTNIYYGTGTATLSGFGVGATANNYSYRWGAGAGGGGYYGGGAGGSTQDNGSGNGGAGGSSYISGHTGAVAITSQSNQTPKAGCTTGTTDNDCSIHYSGLTFTDTVMIDGAGYNWTNTKGSLVNMPNPSGGTYASGIGHTGAGYARITYLGDN